MPPHALSVPACGQCVCGAECMTPTQLVCSGRVEGPGGCSRRACVWVCLCSFGLGSLNMSLTSLQAATVRLSE